MQITEETIEGKIYIRRAQQLMFMLLLYTEHISKDNLSSMQITEATIEGIGHAQQLMSYCIQKLLTRRNPVHHYI